MDGEQGPVVATVARDGHEEMLAAQRPQLWGKAVTLDSAPDPPVAERHAGESRHDRGHGSPQTVLGVALRCTTCRRLSAARARYRNALGGTQSDAGTDGQEGDLPHHASRSADLHAPVPPRAAQPDRVVPVRAAGSTDAAGCASRDDARRTAGVERGNDRAGRLSEMRVRVRTSRPERARRARGAAGCSTAPAFFGAGTQGRTVGQHAVRASHGAGHAHDGRAPALRRVRRRIRSRGRARRERGTDRIGQPARVGAHGARAGLAAPRQHGSTFDG